MTLYDIREPDGTVFPMPASQDIATVKEVARHISKGNGKFPSKVVLIMEEDTDHVHEIYAFGRHFVPMD